MTETQPTIVHIGADNPADAFVVVRFNVQGDLAQVRVDFVACPAMPPRDTLLLALKPIAEKLRTFPNCGCAPCKSAHLIAESVIAIIEREDAISEGKSAH